MNTWFPERKAWITGARLFGEWSAWKVFFNAVFLQILLLQLFPPISQLIRRSCSAVYLSLLTPSILSCSDFMKSHSTARKGLRGFRRLFIRSTMTKPWRECRYKRLSKSEVKETAEAAVAADRRNLTARALIAFSANEVEKVRKLPQAHDVSARTIYATLKEVSQLVDQNAFP